MSDDELLIRHAAAWAESKKRTLDAEALADVLDLRRTNDELPDGAWPAGSAERLLLVTWPAYGPPPPDLDLLRETLDTFWGFLRATGRMAAGSSSPADLRKEAKRSLPKMMAAYDDPERHSQGRVLGDFGRSIGIELDGAADIEELRERLALVQEAWNALPQEERIRRMPDPSPKSVRGTEWTSQFNEGPGGAEHGAEEPFRKGDVRASAQTVREEPFFRACLELADWVGAGREATKAGLLRPAVAREAYQHLDLWPWDRAYDRLIWGRRGLEVPDDPESDGLMAGAALTYWHSAGDCLPLDRLWFPVVEAGLVDLGSRRAVAVPVRPTTDEEWQNLGLTLVASLFRRLGTYRFEPILGVITLPALAETAVKLAEVRTWWDSRCPPPLRGSDVLDWQGRLDTALYHFADCGMYAIDGDEVSVTEFGRDCVVVLTGMIEDGMIEDGMLDDGWG